MNRRLSILLLALAVVISNLMILPGAYAAPISPDTTNRQYFFYNNKVIALVGTSAEYLPHVSQMNDTDKTRDERYLDRGLIYVTYENYPAFIDDISGRGMNKIRMWVGLNHSPARENPAPSPTPYPAPTPTPTPYPSEQPFKYDTTANKWDVTQNVWDETFFDRVREVIEYAATKDVIVEVTLFDPWSGSWTRGPWYQANVKATPSPTPLPAQTTFTARQFFCAFDNTANGELTTTDNATGNKEGRKRQVAFMKRMVDEINHLDNFYWELANEPDINPVGNNVNLTATIAWHNYMAKQLFDYESTKPNGAHKIAVNYTTDDTLNSLRTVGTGHWTNTLAEIVSSHYTHVDDVTDADADPDVDIVRNGAIEMIRKYHAPLDSLNRIFGFNEGKIYPTTNNANITSVRVEAWEFMFNEGGLFDHLGYEWNVQPIGGGVVPATRVRAQLGALAKFLNGDSTTGWPGLILRKMSRVSGSPPAWISSGIGTYGSGGKYYGSMQWLGNQYVIYIHHSNLHTDKLKYYVPVSGSYSENFQVKLGTVAGCFKAEWIKPDTGQPIGTATMINWPSNPPSTYSAAVAQSPTYLFDIALRVIRQPAGTLCQ